VWCQGKLAEHQAHIVEHLEDMPDVTDWTIGDWAQQG
jgi:xylulose-5-phosphate/fructose-6-phosphate phosphoketolase